MNKIKSLLVFGAMSMAASMSWGQTAGAGSITELPNDENSKQAYQLVSPRGTLYYDASVEANYLTSNCETGRNWNNGVHSVELTNEGSQFLLFPGRTEHGFYIYNVAKQQFIVQSGVRAGFTDTPTEVFVWAHGRTGTGSQAYSHFSFDYSDYGFTIGAAYKTSPNYNTINVCMWDNGNPDYRWCNTSSFDDGNSFAIVPAAEVSVEVWQDAYNKIHPAPAYTFDANKIYTLNAEKSSRGLMTYNTAEGTYNGPGLADVTLSGFETIHPKSAEAGVSIRWQINDNGDGTVTLFNLESRKYLAVQDQDVIWSDTPVVFTYAKESDGSYHFQSAGKYLCAACGWQESQGAIKLVSHEDACDFVVTEIQGITVDEVPTVEVTIGSAGYATLYADKALFVPAGVKAYVLQEEGNYLAATYTGSIPAQTGVMLEAEPGTYTFSSYFQVDCGVTTCLSGTLEAMTAPENCYVLGNDEGIGFYKFEGTLSAGKAYYAPAAESRGFAIKFGELTGIQAAVNAPATQSIFDLQGRRVSNVQSGLYIVNGKKVVK